MIVLLHNAQFASVLTCLVQHDEIHLQFVDFGIFIIWYIQLRNTTYEGSIIVQRVAESVVGAVA